MPLRTVLLALWPRGPKADGAPDAAAPPPAREDPAAAAAAKVAELLRGFGVELSPLGGGGGGGDKGVKSNLGEVFF